MTQKEITITKRGTIQSEDDITRLGFLDWSRTIRGPGHDMRNLERLLSGNMYYTVGKENLREAPQRSDFPEWHHTGNHVQTAQNYWNWFHHHFWWVPEKELVFSDSPDFWGSFVFPAEDGEPERHAQFWGDIGRVSLRGFVQSLTQMRPGDLWITFYDDSTQLILEAMADFYTAMEMPLP